MMHFPVGMEMFNAADEEQKSQICASLNCIFKMNPLYYKQYSGFCVWRECIWSRNLISI